MVTGLPVMVISQSAISLGYPHPSPPQNIGRESKEKAIRLVIQMAFKLSEGDSRVPVASKILALSEALLRGCIEVLRCS